MNHLENYTEAMVSIIVPVYNVEKYVEECLTSIIEQTYKKLQIILIDDGSTDSSGRICDEFARRDERIEVIHQKNQGLSAARNAGIDIAKGEYTFFVDSDDYIARECIEHCVQLMKPDVDMVMFDFNWYKEGVVEKSMIADGTVNEISGTEYQYRFYDTLGKSLVYLVVWNKLYRSKVFKEIRFPVGKYYEDGAVLNLLTYDAKRILYLHEALYIYRVVTTGIMHKKPDLYLFDSFDNELNKVDLYVKKNNYDLIKKIMWRYMVSLPSVQNALEIEHVDCRKLVKQYLVKFDQLLLYRENMILSYKEKLRLAFFSKAYNMYYLLWKLKKNNIFRRKKAL